HRRDLYTAIAGGEFPSWTLSIQVMPYDEAKTYRINPFDLTKIWPHADFPLIKVGTMTLNRNVENFFAEIEQAAFEPSALVPGIGFSPDKMLLGRAFAYADTHRHRIGANYLQLPVNRPRVPTNSYTFDGAMAYDHSGDAPVYAPNSFDRPYSDITGPVEDGWQVDGEMTRTAYELRIDDDDFGQPGTLVRGLGRRPQATFVDTVAGHLLGGVTGDVLDQRSTEERRCQHRSSDRTRCGPAPAAPIRAAIRTTRRRPPPIRHRVRHPGRSMIGPGQLLVSTRWMSGSR
ncbi:MAG: catalase, partial [Nakamurella sp.]